MGVTWHRSVFRGPRVFKKWLNLHAQGKAFSPATRFLCLWAEEVIQDPDLWWPSHLLPPPRYRSVHIFWSDVQEENKRPPLRAVVSLSACMHMHRGTLICCEMLERTPARENSQSLHCAIDSSWEESYLSRKTADSCVRFHLFPANRGTFPLVHPSEATRTCYSLPFEPWFLFSQPEHTETSVFAHWFHSIVNRTIWSTQIPFESVYQKLIGFAHCKGHSHQYLPSIGVKSSRLVSLPREQNWMEGPNRHASFTWMQDQINHTTNQQRVMMNSFKDSSSNIKSRLPKHCEGLLLVHVCRIPAAAVSGPRFTLSQLSLHLLKRFSSARSCLFDSLGTW